MSIELTTQIKQAARELGFSLVGVCSADAVPNHDRFLEWLERGYHGEMAYLPERREAYGDPRAVLSGVSHIVMLGMEYRVSEPQATDEASGRIACYGWGLDYHDLIHARLKKLKQKVSDLAPDTNVRGVVDTAPILEREFARLAGLGWVGKHTLLLNREQGSWFFLAALLVDVPLHEDAPFEADHCGTCTACLDACPTDAFPEPYVLDARRCISYLTIELRGPIPGEFRRSMGDWAFGCDVCQDVCPWNKRASTTTESAFLAAAGNDPFELYELFDLDDDAFRARFRKTPLWRSKRRGILRNAAIVLGNKASAAGIGPLSKGLRDEEPLVRGASAWALGEIDDGRAHDQLLEALNQDTDKETDEEARWGVRWEVRWEVQSSLHRHQQRHPSEAWSVAYRLATALDARDNTSARQLLADECVYEINGETIVGADEIIASYDSADLGGQERFDQVEYESAVACLSADRCVVHYRDHLRLAERTHTFQCRQWLTVDQTDLCVVHIRHEELPGERDRLERFERLKLL